jgi:hypothetical protein
MNRGSAPDEPGLRPAALQIGGLDAAGPLENVNPAGQEEPAVIRDVEPLVRVAGYGIGQLEARRKVR